MDYGTMQNIVILQGYVLYSTIRLLTLLLNPNVETFEPVYQGSTGPHLSQKLVGLLKVAVVAIIVVVVVEVVVVVMLLLMVVVLELVDVKGMAHTSQSPGGSRLSPAFLFSRQRTFRRGVCGIWLHAVRMEIVTFY